jgi:hypothetical protein
MGSGPSIWYCRKHDPAKGLGTPGLPKEERKTFAPAVTPRKFL